MKEVSSFCGDPAAEQLWTMLDSIPSGICVYRVNDGQIRPLFRNQAFYELLGYSEEHAAWMGREDGFTDVHPEDRGKLKELLDGLTENDGVLRHTLRIFSHREKEYRYFRLEGSMRRQNQETKLLYVVFSDASEQMRLEKELAGLYVVLAGMSKEAQLFESIANETADAIYVIDKENYDLLYLNESKHLFTNDHNCTGQKCYAALHGKSRPCEFCTLRSLAPDGKEHEMAIEGSDRFYVTRFRENIWNGIPAYVKYVRDVTEEVRTRREKERLEEYFQTVLKNLPGGIVVVRCEQDNTMVPEFISDGFASMTSMTTKETWELYHDNILAGVHPHDLVPLGEAMAAHIAGKERCFELVYRLLTGSGAYIWVKNTLSLIQNEGGDIRFYAVFHDITKEREEQEQLRRQFKERLMQHYGTTDPNALVMGHCNITRNRILEISDHTDSGLLETFGSVREEFFTGLSSLVTDEKERQEFLDMYLNEPAKRAFERNDTERIFRCFIRLPKEQRGRYAQFKVNLVDAPDTGDITGILTVTDVTEQTITDRILHQLSVTSYDFVIDLNLEQDTYTILTFNECANCLPKDQGSHSQRIKYMTDSIIVPRDRARYAKALNPDYIRQRLEKEGAYTFSFSIADDQGDIRIKNMTVSAVELRLGRVCLVRTDITDSLREQQGLLHIMAYTFELVGFINIYSKHLTMHTRQTVLENLAPYEVEHYDRAVGNFISRYDPEGGNEDALRQFQLENILRQLAIKPAGYDFVFPYHGDEGVHYKQINVLWGDENHRTVCLVRADVTDMLAAERNAKNALEDALALAREANQAKSDFLSAMSHDIRTPMNAIIGMTALAASHLNDKDRVEDCLKKISVSSRHLLSLINDILDMSKIERSKITLNLMKLSMSELVEQISAIMVPQAKAAGQHISIRSQGIRHEYFYGDKLRINQILLNLLSNAVKFTPEGGSVEFLVEELEPLTGPGKTRYCFTVSDTGIGMPQEFLDHIFEPFSRSETRIEGTGLGLSITKGLVDLMGGAIEVESGMDEGSTFRLELECRYVEAADEARKEHCRAQSISMEELFAGRCFLVAEDNDINAEILCELLKMYGARTVLAKDGAQAVRAFQEASPGTYDAILMDIRMPVMNGYDAARAIRNLKRPDAGEIPVIAMTANAFSEDVQEAMDAGMNAHVAKPIDMEVLQMTLGSVLGPV